MAARSAKADVSASASRRSRVDVAFWVKIACLAALLVVVYLLSFLVGSVDLSVVTVVDIIRSSFMEVEAYWDGVLEQIVLGVRFPQITLSVLVV